jgi:uncharacterized protein with FMN-binding domain
MNKHNILVPVAILSLSALSACTLPGTEKSDISTASSGTVSSGTISAETQPSQVVASWTTETSIITRTETLSYDSRTPEGMVEIEFSVSVKDGIITAASATPKTEKQGSRYNQDAFVKELSAKVVGKKAKDLNVDAIGGASLTTDAFETFVHSF